MRGVTLVELLIVIVVVAILAGIAVPNYRQYLIRSNRTDATAALLRIAAAQEKFYLQNNRYADTDEFADPVPDGLGIGNTERNLYTLNVALTATGFTATATAPSTSSQYADRECRSFTITETGERGALSPSNTNARSACWR